MKVLLLGDLHGNWQGHKKRAARTDREQLLEGVESNKGTIALGDVGFQFSYLKDLDSRRHKVLGGNHDNYPLLQGFPHYLGDWGVVPGFKGWWFVRGAFSIDQAYRQQGLSWWPEEELTIEAGWKCLEAFRHARPRVVLSHDCPLEVLPVLHKGGRVYPPTRTGQLLQAMLEAHQPERWYFGHHHKCWTGDVRGTRFRCVGEEESCWASVEEEEDATGAEPEAGGIHSGGIEAGAGDGPAE